MMLLGKNDCLYGRSVDWVKGRGGQSVERSRKDGKRVVEEEEEDCDEEVGQDGELGWIDKMDCDSERARNEWSLVMENRFLSETIVA